MHDIPNLMIADKSNMDRLLKKSLKIHLSNVAYVQCARTYQALLKQERLDAVIFIYQQIGERQVKQLATVIQKLKVIHPEGLYFTLTTQKPSEEQCKQRLLQAGINICMHSGFSIEIIAELVTQLMYKQHLSLASSTPSTSKQQNDNMWADELYRDFLTKIGNRHFFEFKLQQQMQYAQEIQQGFYLAFVDVDEFKRVNDIYGHDMGDLLLQNFATRLLQSLPERAYCARLGGDEFVVIIDVQSYDLVECLLEELIQRLQHNYDLLGKLLKVSASVGVAYYDPRLKLTHRELLKSADLALYQAKARGKNQYRFFSAELNALDQWQHQIELALHQAIINQEFQVYYQPVIDLKTRRIFCLEALIRWQSNSLVQKILPHEFIKVAEKTGQILMITQIVTQLVCEDIVKWQQMVVTPPLVSINISLMDLMSDYFEQRLAI